MTKPTITYGHSLLEDNDTLWDTLVYTTSGVGLVTTTVDASLTEANDFWNGFYIKYLTGANAGLYREITDFDAGTDTLTHVAFPNITGNGDTYAFSKWRRTAGTQDLDGEAISTIYNDYLKLDCAAAEAGDYCYWDLYHHATTGPGAAGPLNLNTDISRKVLVRWKTGVASAGLGLTAVAVYQGGTSDYIVGTVYTSPQFSTGWTVSTLTLDLAKTLDYIRIYAYSDTNATTGSVYVDFILVCQGIFTWPFTGGVKLRGHNNNQYLKPLSKVGNATQYLGADDSTLQIYGDIDSTGTNAAGVPLVGEGWHGKWTTHDGEAFYQILHYGFGDPWQWFTSDVASFKVTIDDFEIDQIDTSKNLLWYELDLHEYRLGSASVETHLERFGIT
jgi:hypothetical protein